MQGSLVFASQACLRELDLADLEDAQGRMALWWRGASMQFGQQVTPLRCTYDWQVRDGCGMVWCCTVLTSCGT